MATMENYMPPEPGHIVSTPAPLQFQPCPTCGHCPTCGRVTPPMYTYTPAYTNTNSDTAPEVE